MSSPYENPRNNTPQPGGYPLAMLFIVVGICGITLALVAPTIRAITTEKVGVLDAIAAAVATGIALAAFGALFGWGQFHRGRGVAVGIGIGFALGAVIGPTFIAPPQSISQFLVVLVGSAVIVVVGAVLRVINQNS